MVNVERSLSADLIAQQNFGPARRGFDPEEVRAFLVKVAAEIVALHERQAALEDARRDAEYRAAHPSFDEETLLGAVGEETAHILRSAHDAAGDIKTRAEENASRILKEAHQKAEAVRGQAETVLARRTEEAEGVAARIKETAKAEAERLVDQARQQTKAIRAQAEAERNAMIEGAQATREKILSALTKKRNVAVAQVEQLRAGRERLLEAYEIVRRTLDEATSDLARAEVEARAAADAVRHRPLALDDPDGLEDDPEPTNPTMPIIQKRLRPVSADPGAPPPRRPAPPIGTPPPVRSPGPQDLAATPPAGPMAAPRDTSTTPDAGGSESAPSASVAPPAAPGPPPPVPASPKSPPAPTNRSGYASAGSAPSSDVPAGEPRSREAPTAEARSAPAIADSAPAGETPSNEASSASAPIGEVPSIEGVAGSAVLGEVASAGVGVAGSAAMVENRSSESVAGSAPIGEARSGDGVAGSAPTASSPLAAVPTTASESGSDATAAAPAGVAGSAAAVTADAPSWVADDAPTGSNSSPALPAGLAQSPPSTPTSSGTDRPASTDGGSVSAGAAEIVSPSSGPIPPKTAEKDPTGAPTPGAAMTADPSLEGAGGDTASESGVGTQPATAATSPNSVESLFARIRADRDKAVAHAHEVLAGDSPVPDEDEMLLQRRDVAIEPIEANLTRRLKRALQDDQNDLLDRLRGLRPSQKAADVVLPGRDAHLARFRDAGKPFLREAITAGVTFMASMFPSLRPSEHLGGVDQAADDLAEAVVDPLRRRLQDVLSAGEGDDPVVLAEAVGAAYREWKTKRVEVVASDLVAAAFAAGAYATTPTGTRLRWLVLDIDGPCPDCDDNALAGGQPKGEPYPTGQRHPPAHAGCRCLLIPQLA